MPKITKSLVDRIDKPGYTRDSELRGFAVRAYLNKRSNSLAKTYIVNGKIKGTQTTVTVTIGTHGVVSTDLARTEAKKIVAQLADGIHPNNRKRALTKNRQKELKEQNSQKELETITLRRILLEYLASRQLKEKSKQDYIRFTKRCLGDWLSKPINKISRDMVQKRYLLLSKSHPAQANYTMRVLRALFSYAIAVYESPDGRPLLTHNPVDRLKHARLWVRTPRRQTVIRPHDLTKWYQAVISLSNSAARDLLLIEIFTGLRHTEAASLKWSNVDFNAKTMKFVDTKNHEDHMLPMCTYVEGILQKRFNDPCRTEFVFPGTGKSGYLGDIRECIKKVRAASGINFTEHDLRRTFETTAESLDVSYYSLKKLLNHKLSSDPTSGYIVTSSERLRESAQRIGDFFAKEMGISL